LEIPILVANTKKNPKEKCKAVLTRSQRKEIVEKEKRVEGAMEDVSDDGEGKDKKKKMSEEKIEKMKKKK